ncbi:uncharacterized protein LOC105192506 [Harpegnathos saltator]|uniref:Uncharacterized protein n=1 Tax=Harpegnathos saltator TaxID=610380 RepID=E2B9A1_HARSA|nr:uncharacterized protein LOC105192506 [Harpegnathos saltator]EFN87749.1 hypothetical protein EAI_02679 [Harpegnathos saltator]
MEQNVTETNLLNQDEQAKKEESWLMAQSADENQQQQTQNTSIFYKLDNNTVSTGELSELPANTKWWKDTSTEDIKLTSEPVTILVETYPLIERAVDIQSSDLPQNSLILNDVSRKESMKKLIKCKQKKARSLKESKESIKRAKHPENWKVNVKKNARLRGEEYIGVGGKIVPAKTMGPPCNCRMHCADKIDEEEREELHKVFWKTCTWEQRKQYIALSVKESPKQRTRCRGNVKSEHRRQVTFTYSLLLKGEFITVCKSMFLSTFAVSEKFVRHVMDKKRTSPGGIIGPDQRGRHTPKTKKSEDVKDRVREHIKSFPAERSTDSKDRSGKCYLDSRLSIAAMHKYYVLKCKQDGVPESDIVKESYYREMFKTEFNLGFKRI